MADLQRQAGPAVEYKVGRNSVQLRPQSQLRLRQDVQAGLKVCQHYQYVRSGPCQAGRPLPLTVRVQEFSAPVVIVRHRGALRELCSPLHSRAPTMQKSFTQLIEYEKVTRQHSDTFEPSGPKRSSVTILSIQPRQIQ